MSTESEGSEAEAEPQGFRMPPFPIFPILMPLMFPMGFVAMLIMLGTRRQRALEARLAEVEERLEDLTEEACSPQE
jgi:hypothetical protein